MKATETFKETIKAYLDNYAKEDPLFDLNYQRDGKNIDDCIKYIFTQVKKSGINGFTDDEVYNMAIHYYDEESIEFDDIKDCNVIVNHKVELTSEEITEAKDKAKKTIFNEEQIRLKAKPKKVEVKKENVATQGSLF